MKCSFVLTPEAAAGFREILLDIAEDSADAAECVLSEFYETFQGGQFESARAAVSSALDTRSALPWAMAGVVPRDRCRRPKR